MSPTIKKLSSRPLLGFVSSLLVVPLSASILYAVQVAQMDVTKGPAHPSYVGYILPIALIAAIWGWRPGIFTLALSLFASNVYLSIAPVSVHFHFAQDPQDRIALLIVGGMLVIALDRVRASGAKTERLLDTVLAQQAQRQYVLDSLPVSVILCDLNGHIMSMNPASIDLHGYNTANLSEIPDTLAALSANIVFFDKDWNRIDAENSPLLQAARNLSFDNYTVHAQRPDTGRYWDASYAATTVKDHDGDPVLNMITARDITDVQTVESALRISEDRLKMALDAAHIAIWQWDMIADTLLWSAHSESIVGVADGAEIPFDTFIEMIHPEDRVIAKKSLKEALDARQLCEIAYRVVLPGGGVRTVSSKGQGYYNIEGTPTRMEGVAVEATDPVLRDGVVSM